MVKYRSWLCWLSLHGDVWHRKQLCNDLSSVLTYQNLFLGVFSPLIIVPQVYLWRLNAGERLEYVVTVQVYQPAITTMPYTALCF